MKKERIQKLKKMLAQKGIEYEQDYSKEEAAKEVKKNELQF